VLADNGSTRTFSGTDLNETGGTRAIAGANSGYFDDNGRMAAIGLDNNSVQLADASGSTTTLTGHSGLVRTVAFSKDGSTVATGARDSALIIWKGTTQVKKIRLSSRIRALAFHPLQNAVIAGTEDGSVYLCSIDGDEKKTLTSHPGSRVQAIRCTAGGRIFIAFSNGQVELLGTSGQLIKTWNEPGSADLISIDEKNDLLAIATAGVFCTYTASGNFRQSPLRSTSARTSPQSPLQERILFT
jgi:WD40 repeat protein